MKNILSFMTLGISMLILVGLLVVTIPNATSNGEHPGMTYEEYCLYGHNESFCRATVYCIDMGLNPNESDCVFPDNKSCGLFEFYNGSCGTGKVKNLSCAKAGESLEPGKICCEDLILMPGGIEYKEDGTCGILERGTAWPICAPCGNGVCEDIENKCNCAIDCGFPEVNISKIREKIIKKLNITFLPWQKRNESECLQGCNCVGAVMSCITETGKTITIIAGSSGNVIIIIIEKTNVSTELEIEQEITVNNRTRIKAKVSRGYIEIKIMPDTASERALERLKLKVCSIENNCTIVLKEVGQDKDKKLAYELQAERHAKLLSLFRTKMQVKAQVNAENGEIIIVKKPWWAFLASEPEE